MPRAEQATRDRSSCFLVSCQGQPERKQKIFPFPSLSCAWDKGLWVGNASCKSSLLIGVKGERDAMKTASTVPFFPGKMFSCGPSLQFVWVLRFPESPTSTFRFPSFVVSYSVFLSILFSWDTSATLKAKSWKPVWLSGCVYSFQSECCFWLETESVGTTLASPGVSSLTWTSVVKVLKEHSPCKNSQKWLDGVLPLGLPPCLTGELMPDGPGVKGEPRGTIPSLGQQQAEPWICFASFCCSPYVPVFSLQTSMFFSSVPLWKRLMWLAMARGLTWITNYSHTFEVIGLLYLPFRETLGFTELLLFSTNFGNYQCSELGCLVSAQFMRSACAFWEAPLTSWCIGKEAASGRGQYFPTLKFATKF